MCKQCDVSNIKIVVSRTPAYSSDSSASNGEDEIRYQNCQTVNVRISKVKVIPAFDDAVVRFQEYVKGAQTSYFHQTCTIPKVQRIKNVVTTS